MLLEVAPGRPDLDEQAARELSRQHLGHFRKMKAARFLRVAGPVDEDDAIAGSCVYQAGSAGRARKLAEDDPAVRAGRLVARVMTWYTLKGALTWGDAGSPGG